MFSSCSIVLSLAYVSPVCAEKLYKCVHKPHAQASYVSLMFCLVHTHTRTNSLLFSMFALVIFDVAQLCVYNLNNYIRIYSTALTSSRAISLPTP
jgi:hypothetical protein